jgi:hypothetical protein
MIKTSDFLHLAIMNLDVTIGSIQVISPDNIICLDNDGGSVTINEDDVNTEIDRLQAEYDAQEYARNRQAEYPSLLELTVALYDTDDKSAVEAKRAAVKLKYPKPE